MQFLYQNVLFLMLLPLILLIILISTNKDSMQKVFNPAILSKLSISNKYLTKTSRNVLFFISLILMVLALSRPVINETEKGFKQEITPIIVAVDISKSMLANDISPSRLQMAKNKLLEIIEQSKHNGVGVILFAKSAFILSPITQDFNSLKYLVNHLDNGLNFDNGSNIYATLEAANKLLKNYTNKNLLLLTDGGNKSDFQEEISYAKENKLKVYTIALATKKPTPIKIDTGYLMDKDNNIVTVSLNEAIKTLSLKTSGGYIEYSLNQHDIRAILSDIETQSQKDSIESQKFKVYTELFYYPLALALFLLLFAFSSFPKKSLIALALLFSTYENNMEASILDFQTIKEANQAYENKKYDKATTSFQKVSKTPQGHYNFANSLYKDKKYNSALNEYKKITTSDKALEYKKLHNLGNAYVKTNDLENAKKMYEKALSLQDDAQTKKNLDLVNQALKQQQKKNQKGNKNNKDKKENKDKEKQQQKNGDKKEDNKKQKDKKNKEQSKKSQKQDKTKKDSEKKDKNTQKNQQQKQNIKEEKISDLEEKKWLNKITNQKAPILLRKVESKREENSSTPW